MNTERYNYVINNLNYYLKRAGLSKASIAREMDMKQPKVNGYFMLEGASRRDMPLSFLAELAVKYPQLDMNWLFRGEAGELGVEPGEDDVYALKSENERLKEQVAAFKNTICSLSEIITDQKPR